MSFTTASGTFPLIPELFPLIISHLPLYDTPSTVLALGLASRGIYEIVHDLLYSCLILRNEKDSIAIFKRIFDNLGLGQLVRELYVMSELTVATMEGKTAFDTVTGLTRLITGGYIPHLRVLEVRLLNDTEYNRPWYMAKGFGHFTADFWDGVRNQCPRMQSMTLSGIGDEMKDPWLKESGIYELKGMKELNHLGLSFSHGGHAQFDGTDQLLANIHNLSSSLHTLVLSLYNKYDSASPILSHDFPRLRSLTLGLFSVPDTSEAMAFWRRHPMIEKLKLTDTERISHWFSETLKDDLLPNLRFLEASFHDVCAVIPILNRLTGLSIQQSINAQVPFLLRFLIPEGLPNLESLEIDQDWSTDRDTIRRYKGSTWYETPDGKFHQEKKFRNAARTFTDNYIHSIARGAPNIKELCLHGIPLQPMAMANLAPQLAEFAKLERLYYRGVNDSNLSLRTKENRGLFYMSSREIAEKCKMLTRITDISDSPYLAARIRRNHTGAVEEVIPTYGYGMIIGSEDEAFPNNPNPIVNAC